MSRIISIIADQGFQDKEYADSKAALEKAGHTVITASTELSAKGSFGMKVEADMYLSDVKPDNFDAIMFIGGAGCFEYFDDPSALNLAQDFYNNGKITAAICAAPSILAYAGLLYDVKATCWEGEAKTLKKNKANYTGNSVEQDGLIITADGPMSATAFGEKIAEGLCKGK